MNKIKMVMRSHALKRGEGNAKKYSHYNKLNFKEKNSVRLRHKLLCAIGISLGVLIQFGRVCNQADCATN